MTDLLECAGEDDPPICARCGEDYTLFEYDAEPTKYCDDCAHALVEAWEPVVRATRDTLTVILKRLVLFRDHGHEIDGDDAENMIVLIESLLTEENRP